MRSIIRTGSIVKQREILEMREIRNANREFMTHNTSEISKQEQLKWYWETYLPLMSLGKMYGIAAHDKGQMVGYGLVSFREGRYWLSGAVLEEERGRGIGKMLFQEMQEVVFKDLDQTEVWLDVRKDNIVGQNLYRSVGFVACADTEDTIIMVSYRQDLNGGV